MRSTRGPTNWRRLSAPLAWPIALSSSGTAWGGIVATILAGRDAPALGGLIVIDSPIESAVPASRAEADSPSFGHARVYPTSATAAERFRAIPPQPTLPYMAAYVAANSVREVDGGWTWKFDPTFARMTGPLPHSLDGLPCEVVFIAGERGILSKPARRALDISTEITVTEIADAGHAIMLDQPLALLSELRAVLNAWRPAAMPSVAEADSD
jgi:pimeloyl-ACP methyl ester carboxylesterase